MMYELPIPKSPEIFENLVCDILNFQYHTTNFSLYGRRGQKQNGTDIFSSEYNIVVQCKLRTVNLSARKTKMRFITEVLKDLNLIIKSRRLPSRIIIATTIENDTLIQDQLQSILTFNDIPVIIEFWSWSKISNAILLFEPILHKYFPFRQTQVELARIDVLNKSIYKKSSCNELLYNYQNIKNRNHLPIFDFSFINNTADTVILNSVEGYTVHQAVARAGFPPKPSGILKPTKKFIIDLKLSINMGEYDKAVLYFDDPIYAQPKVAFRIQLQNTKPIISFHKIYFVFNFNSTSIQTPDLYFNSYTTFSGILHNRI